MIIVSLWASTTVIGRFLVGIEPRMSALQLASYRYVTGFLTLALIYQMSGAMTSSSETSTLEVAEGMKEERRPLYLPYLITGLILGVFPLLLFESVKYTSASAASFLLNSNTIFIAPLSAFILKDQLPRMQIGGILVATIGVLVLLVGIDPITNWLTSKTFLGNILALLAGMTWAIYTVMSKKWFASVAPLKATIIQLGIGSSFLLLVLLSIERPLLMMNLDVWLMILIIGPGATGLGFWLYFMILDEETATTAGSIQYLVPIFSLVYEWIFLGTLISLVAIIGGLLTLVGLVVADYSTELHGYFQKVQALLFK